MDSKKFNKILITGANGNLGRKLNNYFYLNKNFQILNLVKKKHNNNVNQQKNNYIYSDIKDVLNQKNKLKNIDIVIHLAFPNSKKLFSKKNIDELVYINNQFFKLMASLNVKKFIYISTAKINSFELSQNKNIFNYEMCKLQIEKNLIKLSEKYNKTKLIIVRSGIIYGPQIENNFKKFIDYIISGKIIPLINQPVFKNIIFIDYFLKGIHSIINSKEINTQIIYLYEKNIELIELVNVINSILKRKTIILKIPKYIIILLKILKLDKLIFKSLYDSFYIEESSFYKIDNNQKNKIKFEENLKKTYKLI